MPEPRAVLVVLRVAAAVLVPGAPGVPAFQWRLNCSPGSSGNGPIDSLFGLEHIGLEVDEWTDLRCRSPWVESRPGESVELMAPEGRSPALRRAA